MKISLQPLGRLTAAVAIAVAGAMAHAAPAEAPMGMGGGMGMAEHGPGGMMMHGRGGDGRMLEHMLHRVNATPEQRTQIKQIMDAARADMKAMHEAGRGMHKRGLELLTQPTVDAAALETLRQQALAQHDQGSKRMLKAMVDAARVLTPEQRKQIAETMAKRQSMMERHHQERQNLDKPRN